MATGILSVGMHLEDVGTLSDVLLGVCAAAFVMLAALTGCRFLVYPAAVVEDFTDPRRGFGFFTFVAGTNVLGVRLGLGGWHAATAVLLAFAGRRQHRIPEHDSTPGRRDSTASATALEVAHWTPETSSTTVVEAGDVECWWLPIVAPWWR